MKGTIIAIEKLEGGFELKIEVPNPEFGKNLDLMDVRERRKFRESKEYKEYLKVLGTFEKGIRLGEVEIKYSDEG